MRRQRNAPHTNFKSRERKSHQMWVLCAAKRVFYHVIALQFSFISNLKFPLIIRFDWHQQNCFGIDLCVHPRPFRFVVVRSQRKLAIKWE